MSKRVSIFIEGIARDEDEDIITTNVVGDYRLMEGVHILRYQENAAQKHEGMDDINKDSFNIDTDIVNTIKISDGYVEMIKSGNSSTHMTFDLSKNTESIYETPYGSLQFQIITTKISLEEKQDGIVLHMEYSLSHDDCRISDNTILIKTKKIEGLEKE